MKGSPIWKRYVLVTGSNIASIITRIDRELYQIFRAKRKYFQDRYAIYLTDQRSRDKLLEYIRDRIPEVQTIITSGTIRKCKSYLNKGKDEIKGIESSGLLKN